jgi:hypothetical protein
MELAYVSPAIFGHREFTQVMGDFPVTMVTPQVKLQKDLSSCNRAPCAFCLHSGRNTARASGYNQALDAATYKKTRF